MAGAPRRTWIAIAALNGAIVTIGLLGLTREVFGFGPDSAFLAWSIAGIALTTFFGSLSIDSRSSFPTDRRIRGAIAITVIVVYLTLVAVVAFFEGTIDQPQITRDFVGSLTTTVALIVAAYIGSTAFVDARRDSTGEPASREGDE